MNDSEQDISPERGETESRNPAQIEREIEMTRDRMSENIDELGERLSPRRLKDQAVQSVGEQARRTRSRLADMIRENPLPVIAVGATATWLLTRRSGQGTVSGDRMARYAYTGPERRSGQGWQRAGMSPGVSGAVRQAKEKMSEVASGVSERASDLAESAGELKDRVQERAGELGTQARWQSERVGRSLRQTMNENPLMVVAGAAVVGLAMGFLLPGTEREDEVLGPARDRLVDRAEAVADRVKDATVEAGREVAGTVQEQIEQHKPELKQAAQETARSVKEQVKSSAKRVKNEAQDAARQPQQSEPED